MKIEWKKIALLEQEKWTLDDEYKIDTKILWVEIETLKAVVTKLEVDLANID